MSRLFPDQLRIGLGASYAALASTQGSRLTGWRMQQFSIPATQPAWLQPLEAVMAWLAQLPSRGANLQVMLSAELAPLHLLPWRDDITGAEQQTLLARSHFYRIFGEAVADWKISISPTAYGAGWLASTVDGALLQSLTQQTAALNTSLQMVQPLLISHLNRLRRRLKKTNCWVLLAEPEKLVALHLRKGRCQLLHTLPAIALQHESLQQILLRESRLAGLAELSTEVFLLAPATEAVVDDGAASKLNSGWQTPADMGTSDADYYLLGAAA